MMAAHALTETARDALFLSGLDADQLPYAYLAIAGLAALVVRVNQKMLARSQDKRLLLAGSLGFAAVVDVALGIAEIQGPAALFGLYVWTGLVATVVVVQFWLLLDDVVTVTQAKRIFGPVAAGGVVGALLGSFLAERVLSFGADPHSLLVGAGALLAFAACVPFAWKKERLQPQDVSAPAKSHGLRTLVGHTYLRRLLVLVLFSTIALTGADFLFKSVVAEAYPDPAELASFFALFYTGLNAIALAVQLLLSGWLLRVFGVNRALLVLPLLLVVGATGFALFPVLLPVLLLKGADGSLRHSLHRTAMEVLYLPLPRDLRDRFKGLIDGVGQRGGQALASLGILALLSAGGEATHVGWIVAVLSLVWVSILIGLRASYLELFRSSLRGGHIDGAGQLMELDLHSLEGLLAALNSDQDDEVFVALELFERYNKVSLIPKLILYHPSPEVVQRAMAIFAREGDPGFIPIARRLMRDGDPVLRSSALRAITAVDPDDRLLRDAVESEDPALHATALVGMLASNYPEKNELEAKLEMCLTVGYPEVRVELARALSHQANEGASSALLRLAQAPEEEVRMQAVEAMSSVPHPSYFEILLPMLGDSALRPRARAALLAMDESVLERLAAAFDDPALPRRVRRHIPRTISRFCPEDAIRVLQKQLPRERDGAVRYKILRGLTQLADLAPDVPLDRALFERSLRSTLERVVRMMDLRVAVQGRLVRKEIDGLGADLLAASLKEKEVNALERAFRFLDLLDRTEDYALLWKRLRTGSAKSKAASRELLEHALRGSVRDAVLALMDDAPAPDRLAAASAALRMELFAGSYEQRLATALDDPSDATRSLVAYHIGEMGLTELATELRRAKPERKGFVREVIDRALETLTDGVPSVA